MNDDFIIDRFEFDEFKASDWVLNKKQKEDVGFQQYLGEKYPVTSETQFDEFNASEIEVPTRLQQDQEEYDRKVKGFEEVSMVMGHIPNTHLPLAWNLKKIENKRTKAGMKALVEGISDISYIDREYRKDIAALGEKYGYNPEEIEEWKTRTWRGFLTGFTECLVDMRDVYAKAGGTAAAEIGAGAGIGAVAGSLIPGLGTGAGAVTGTVKGIVVAKHTAIPGATYQDTYDKEAGSFYLSELATKSKWTPEEIRDLQFKARAVGHANATIETGVAMVALPYVNKILMNIPGAEKISSKLVKDGVAKAAKAGKEIPALATKEGVQAYAKGVAKIGLSETSEEMLQEVVNMVGEQSLGHDISLSEAYSRIGEVGVQAIQGAGLPALVGASGAVRIRNKANEANKFVEDINKKIDEVNGVKEEQTKTEQPKTEQATTEQAAQDFSNVTDEALTKSKAEQTVRMKETDNAIAKAETQLEQAKDLGLTEEETTQISSDLEQLKQDKVQYEDEYRAILTEESVRQAKKETETKLEEVNKSIEQANKALDETQNTLSETQTQIKEVQKQIKQAKKKKEDTSKLTKKLEKLTSKEGKLKDKISKQEYNLGNLEKNQEKLLSDKAKLESGQDIQSVLKGKKTTVSSVKVAKAEQRAQKREQALQEAISQNNAKAAKRLVDSLKAAAKKAVNDIAKSYKEGRTSQEKETRSVRQTVSKALRKAGIKRSELGAFDSIIKKVATIPDLVNVQDELQAKIDEVLEKRSREQAWKVTERLRKLAKPFKGSPVKGKMTPAIQNLVDTLFSFTKKSTFEAGFDIQELYNRFNTNPDANLDIEEKIRIVESLIAEQIAQRESRLANLREQEKQARKNKEGWEGRDTKREDAISPTDVEGKVESYSEDRPTSGKKKEHDSVSKEIKNQLAQILSFCNMGLKFGDLKVRVEKSVFTGKLRGNIGGSYNRATQILTVKDKAEEHTIFHEVGHYLDQKLARIFNHESLASLSMDYYIAKGAKTNKVLKALHSLITSEQQRLKKQSWFHKLDNHGKEYLMRPQEIFARVFHAAANKTYGVKVQENTTGKVEELTYTVPETTINDFFNLMDEMKYYSEFGIEIEELENELNALYEESKLTSQNLGKIAKEMMKSVPSKVGDLIYYLQLAADLKNRTTDEIVQFNSYVAALIQTGRDARVEKKAREKEQREKNIQEVREKLKEYAPKFGKDGKIKDRKAFKLFMHTVANFYTKMSSLFGSEIADKWSTILNDTKALSYVFEKKQQFIEKATKIYGYTKGLKGFFGISRVWKEYLKDEDIYTVNRKEEQVQVRLNRMNIIGYYIYSQNETGKARLDNMFSQEEQNRMFGKLTEEDIELAELCIEMADTYDTVNEVFKKDRDIDLPKRQRYFPFASETEEVTVQSFLENNLGFQGPLPSFTKNVVESDKVYLKEINPVSILFSHFQNVGDYVNGYLHNKELANVLNDSRVKNDIKLYYGEEVLNSLLGDVQAITFGKRSTNNSIVNRLINKWGNPFVDAYITSAIAVKPTIAFKQLLSFVNYAEKMPVDQFVKYIAEFMANPKRAINFMMRNEYLRARFHGGSQTEELAHVFESSSYSKTNRLIDFFTLNVRLGDMGAIVFGGYAQVRYLMKVKGYSEQQAFEQFINDTAQTQQFNSRASISSLQAMAKENALARAFFAFTNTPYQYLNKSYNAVLQAKRGEISKQQAAKTVFIYQVLNPILYTTATSLSPIALLLASMYGDDEDKEEALQELFLYDMIGGVLTGNMDLGPINIPEMVFRQMVGEKNLRGVRDIPLSKETKDIVVGTGELLRDIADLASGETDIEDITLEDYLKVVRAAGVIKGLPADYALNVASGVQDLAAVGDDAEFRPVSAVLKFAGYSKKKSESIQSAIDTY